MKKKFALVLSLALVMSLSLTACGKTEEMTDVSSSSGTTLVGKEGGTELNLATGGPKGTYYDFGDVLADEISKTTTTTVTPVSHGGSQANLEALQDGDAEIALVQADVGAYAYDGSRIFEDNRYKEFSTVANLYLEQVQIVTLDPEIKTVEDLEGKTVSVGAAGSGVYFNAADVLGAYDLDIKKDIQATNQSFEDSVEAMQKGDIDACFLTSGTPTEAVMSLASVKPVYLIGLDEAHITKLVAASPYYSESTISKDVYGTPADVNTVSVSAVVMARDDVSDADVYNVLAGIFDNLDAVSAAHPKGSELNLNVAASYDAVPYHSGAVAFFADHNIEVSGK